MEIFELKKKYTGKMVRAGAGAAQKDRLCIIAYRYQLWIRIQIPA
jgi:hypothetical protein